MSLQEWLNLQVAKIKSFYKDRIKKISASNKDTKSLEPLLTAEVNNCKQTLNSFKTRVFQKLNTLQQKNDDSEAEKLLNELN